MRWPKDLALARAGPLGPARASARAKVERGASERAPLGASERAPSGNLARSARSARRRRMRFFLPLLESGRLRLFSLLCFSYCFSKGNKTRCNYGGGEPDPPKLIKKLTKIGHIGLPDMGLFFITPPRYWRFRT